MSNTPAQEDLEDEFAPTLTPGYNPGGSKSPAELAALDQEDESLTRWKASLGIVPGSAAASTEAKIHVIALELASPALPPGKIISIDINNPQQLAALKDDPITIKEGVEYNVRMKFKVSGSIASGIRYLQVVKRTIPVDKSEQMLGSYGPRDEPYTVDFPSEDAPSGLLARSTYSVSSRVIDDDKTVHAKWNWYFKIAKEWSL